MFLEIAPMQEAEMILGSNNCCYGNRKVKNQIHHIYGSAPKFSQQGCTHSVKVFTQDLFKLYIVTYFLLEEE
jgi:hypothetical protein